MGLAPGTTIGHYDVTSLLGEGGMGQVWQATDTQLNRQVALKILTKQDAAAAARLLDEARAASALNHPNVCIIHGVEDAPDGSKYIVMEYVEGKPLGEMLRPCGLQRRT